MAARGDGPPQLGIQGLYGIRCINDPTDLAGEGKERDDFLPHSAPALADVRIFLPPMNRRRRRREPPRRLGHQRPGPVDVLERGGDRLVVLVGHEIHGIPEQMDDAGLHDRLGKDGSDRLRAPLQAIDHSQQDVLDTAVLSLNYA